MHRVGILVSVFAIFAGCGFCSGVLVMFAPDAPKRSFAVEALLIDETKFPEGWEVSERDSRKGSCTEGPGEETRVYISPKEVKEQSSLRVVEVICQYDKTWRASLQYDRLSDSYKFAFYNEANPPAGFDTWETPSSEIPFTSDYADKWRFACQSDEETNHWYHCTYFALYHEYLVDLDIWNGDKPESMSLTLNEINSLLQAVDERMASYLNAK